MATTNKEVMLGFFGFEIPEALVEKALIDRAVSGTANYTSADTEKVELAVADLCLLVTLSSESEGGYSITYDAKKLNELRSRLPKKHGVEDEDAQGSTIRARNVW